MKFCYNWPCGFYGDYLECQNIRDLGQKSKNYLDLMSS